MLVVLLLLSCIHTVHINLGLYVCLLLFLEVALNAKHYFDFLYLPPWSIPHTGVFCLCFWGLFCGLSGRQNCCFSMSQHIDHSSAGVSAQAPALWRMESNPRVFTLRSQKQPSSACSMAQLLLSQWWMGWVCSLAEPPENGTTPKQILKLSTDSFCLLSGQNKQ